MKKILLHFSAFVLFFLAATYITYPLIFHITSLATGLSDELVIAWIQNWVIHALLSNPLQLFNADIYYPFQNSLAYSDIHLTTAVLTSPFLFLFKQPIITYNITQFSSFVLLGFCTYLLAYFLTKNFLLSVLSGVLVVFSPVTLDKHVHVQILAVEGVTLAILFFITFLQTPKTKFLIFSLVCFVLQTYNSFLQGYFIIFAYFFFSLFFFVTHKKQFMKLITVKNILFILFAFVLIVPIAIPYFQVSKEFHYTRDIRDTIHFAIQPEDMVFGGSFSRLQPLLQQLPINQTSLYGEVKPGFLGLTLSILSICTFVFAWRKRKEVKKYWIFFAALTTAITGFVLSFGPALHLNRVTIHHPFPIPLPYVVFYYMLPGFQGFRNTGRFVMLFVLFIVICIAIMLHEILGKIASKKRAAMVIVFIIIAIAEFPFPLYTFPVPQLKNFPKEYNWLTTTPKDTKIVEMPIYNWSMLPYSYQEQLRGYYNTSYFRTTMSGFSGFSPPPWQKLVTNLLFDFPNARSLQKLHNLHITYILVHKNEFDMLFANHFKVLGKQIQNGAAVVQELKQNSQVQLVKQFGDTYIFKAL